MLSFEDYNFQGSVLYKHIPYSRKFFQVKISTNLVQWYCAKSSPNLVSRSPKFFPGRIPNHCKCCVNTWRRWQVTSIFLFQSSSMVATMKEDHLAGSGSSGLCHGKPPCSVQVTCTSSPPNNVHSTHVRNIP